MFQVTLVAHGAVCGCNQPDRRYFSATSTGSVSPGHRVIILAIEHQTFAVSPGFKSFFEKSWW